MLLDQTFDTIQMVHDYFQFIIQDLLDKNGEIYITSQDIQHDSDILGLLNNATPDLILKKNGTRPKTVMIHISPLEKSLGRIKQKYEPLAFFSNVCIVTQFNYMHSLKDVLPFSDIEFYPRKLHQV